MSARVQDCRPTELSDDGWDASLGLSGGSSRKGTPIVCAVEMYDDVSYGYQLWVPVTVGTQW